MVFSINELLILWESYGVFDTLMPFLLIFAVVFGILSYLKIFGDNKGIHVIIAIVIGLMAARFPYFTQFYEELFPRLGIGITILLAILILLGLFFTDKNRQIWAWILIIMGVVVGLIVIYNTFDVLGWSWLGSYGGGEVAAWVITAVLLIGVIVAVVISNDTSTSTSKAHLVPLFGTTSK